MLEENSRPPISVSANKVTFRNMPSKVLPHFRGERLGTVSDQTETRTIFAVDVWIEHISTWMKRFQSLRLTWNRQGS